MTAAHGHLAHDGDLTWDPAFDRMVRRVPPGGLFVTRVPELLVTQLGSCVAACIRDPVAGIGGMNHFLVPGGPDHTHHVAPGRRLQYGAYAMAELVDEILAHGGQVHRLEAKLFGGAEMLTNQHQVGHHNAVFAREFLSRAGITLAAADTGGQQARRLYYAPAQGSAWVRLTRRAGRRDE